MKKITIILIILLLSSTAFALPSSINIEGVSRHAGNNSLRSGNSDFGYYLINNTDTIYSQNKTGYIYNGIFNLVFNQIDPKIFLTRQKFKVSIDGINFTEHNLTVEPYSMVSHYSNDSIHLDGQPGSYYLDDTDTTCAVDGSCGSITYDSETSGWDKDTTDDVTTTQLDNKSIIRLHNTSWITDNQNNFDNSDLIQADLGNRSQIESSIENNWSNLNANDTQIWANISAINTSLGLKLESDDDSSYLQNSTDANLIMVNASWLNVSGGSYIGGGLNVSAPFNNEHIRMSNLGGSNAGLYGYSATPTRIWSLTRQDAIVGVGDLALGSFNGIGFKGGEALPTSYHMYLESSGQVGIGTATPDYELDVAGNIGLNEYLYHNDDTDTYIIFKPDQINMSTSAHDGIALNAGLGEGGGGPTHKFGWITGPVGSPHLTFEAGPNYAYFQNGDVGIDTTAPGAELDVHGNVIISDGTDSCAQTGDGDLCVDNDLEVDGTVTIASTTTIAGTLDLDGNTLTSAGDLSIDSGGQVEFASGDTINIGGANDRTYNSISDSGATSRSLSSDDDLYIEDRLEVDGLAYFDGGHADIAEVLPTKRSINNPLCDNVNGCSPSLQPRINSENDTLDYGDVACIDIEYQGHIMKCNSPNSRLAVGVISNTTVLYMGGDSGYPVAVAGIVFTKVTNESGNIVPGDLLVSANTPGFAMKNNKPSDGTVIGKAFDFCDSEECTILMFVALS